MTREFPFSSIVDAVRNLPGLTKLPETIKKNHLIAREHQMRQITIDAPLEGERFVSGETQKFRALAKLFIPELPGVKIVTYDGSQLKWVSDRDGIIGIGGEIVMPKLSIGSHKITVSGYNISKTVTIRIFSNLMDLYHTEPSQKEIERIKSDFNIIYKDTASGPADQQWSAYENQPFNPQSPNPSKMVIIANLDLLRHQQIEKTPPFTGGLSVYDYLKKFTHTFELYLTDDFYNYAGGGVIHLTRPNSCWIMTFNTGEPVKNSDGSNMSKDYTYILQLILHETRHNDSTDPGHVDCKDWFYGTMQNKIDQEFENGSGWSNAYQYYMYVYKHGLFDTADTKAWAKNEAWRGLRTSFCNKPTHSDPVMQVIIDELLQ